MRKTKEKQSPKEEKRLFIVLIHFIVLRIVQFLSTIHHPRLKSIPFLYFSRDHLRSLLGTICGRGSFAVLYACSNQINWNYLIPLLFTGSFAVSFGDHLRSGIICGTVCMFKSDKLKLSDFHDYFHLSLWPFYLWTTARGYWLFVLIVSFSFINSL